MISRILVLYRSAFSGLPRPVWLLSLIILVNRSGSMVLFFMSLYLTRELGYSVAVAGQMISLYGIGSLLGAYLGGWFSDRIGSKMVQFLSLLISGFLFIILGYIKTITGIGIMLFLLAAINEAFRPANATALAAVAKPGIRARAFGLNRLAVNLGVAIGPAVGGILATIDYTLLFWIDGVTCLIAAIILSFALKLKLAEQKVPESNHVARKRGPLTDKIYLLLLLILLYMGMVFVQIFSSWPLYLREICLFPENRIGLLLALNAILIVFVEMPLIHKVEKRDQTRVMALGAFLLFLGFALTPLSRSYWFLALTVIIWTIGEMLVFPLVAAFIANRASDENRGKYMGMFTFTFALAFVLGPVSGTFIYDQFGPDILWFGIGSIGFFVLFIFRLIDKQIRREHLK